ncbi:raftlin [Chanos chanos]|uniref:Raftlin n=1 Tax=Chanos chanos TaxID=29144 RepID=A0A6J2W9C0_CHACN|nr:raftlin-like [Chanos chanos]
MGCGLRKIRQSEDTSPGKIYSTLKRPQVETKVGAAYTYRHLDFLVGKEDGTSTLCLSSVRELPSQLQELYQDGYILVAVHPFVHPCGPEPASVQRQLFRAVLIRISDSVEKNQTDFEPYHLKLEECLSADQIPSPEHIQGYVKKQIQDAADQGIMFVGFLQEPAGLHLSVPGREKPEEVSLSLHSSLSSLHSSGPERSPSHAGEQGDPSKTGSPGTPLSKCEDGDGGAAPSGNGDGPEDRSGDAVSEETSAVRPAESSRVDPDRPNKDTKEDVHSYNNNTSKTTDPTEKPNRPSLAKNGAELFTLYNYPGRREGQLKYYTIKVPLRVQSTEEGGVRGVEANWLDHMTQHFNNGASLVDGYFHLARDNDLQPKSVDSVFIFQEGSDGDAAFTTAYDAIVVEQWTVINGVQVKTDYIPLLQSLASYGWRLTCVLPTPVIKTNSDGSFATKQIVFLQRPALPRKKRESKKLIFKTRNKSNKNSVKDAPKNKKKKNSSSTEKVMDEQKICDGTAKTTKEEDERLSDRKENREGDEKRAEVEIARRGSAAERDGEEGSKAGGQRKEDKTEKEAAKEEETETETDEKVGAQNDRQESDVDTKEGRQEEPETESKMEGGAGTEEEGEGEVENNEGDKATPHEEEKSKTEVKEEHREEPEEQFEGPVPN